MKWKTGPADASLQSAISSLRSTVLDVGLDNPLINYKESSSLGLFRLGITPPLAISQLVTQRSQCLFTHDQARSSNANQQSTAAPMDFDASDDSVDEVYSVQPSTISIPTFEKEADLNRRLLATYHYAKASLEEDGMVTLYIALGLLKWRDDTGRQVTCSSPLLLVPVHLERSSGPESFRLVYAGDDVIHNECLYELMRGMNTVLPEISSSKTIDISAYFDAVQRITGPKPHWYTDIDSVSLGFFDCSRMAIHQDLDPASRPAAALLAHPVMAPLLGFGSFPKSEALAGTPTSLDEQLQKSNLSYVLEADSSQLQAMMAIGKGDTVVIQGPPGTGKTQTVVNVIADAVSKQKTVLFVSNKVVALDIVKRRLDDVGLGETTLEFHSTRTRDRNVFQQLRRTLDLRTSQSVVNLEQAAIDKATLEASQRRLNQYCAAVNNIPEPSGESAYSLYSPLMKLEQKFHGKLLPDLELPDAVYWTGTDLQMRRQKLEQMEAALLSCGTPSKHPFWGTSVVVMTPPVREKLRQALVSAEGALAAVNQNLAALSGCLGVPSPATWPEIDLFNRVWSRLEEAPPLAGINLNLATWAMHSRQANETLQSGLELAAIHQRWSSVVAPHAWDADVSRLKDLASNIKGKWWKSTTREQTALQEGMATLVLGGFNRKENTVEIIDAISKGQILSRRINAGQVVMAELYKKNWRGESSSWTALRLQFDWIAGLNKDLAVEETPAWAMRLIDGKTDRRKLTKIADTLQSQRAIYLINRAQVDAMLGIDAEAQGLAVLHSAGDDLKRLQACFSLLVAHIQDFGPLSRYLQLRAENMEVLGQNLIEVADAWEGAAKNLLDLWEYRRLTILLENIFSASPFLAAFDPAQHAKAVTDFRYYDRKCLQWSQSHTAAKHIENIRCSLEHKPKFEAIGAMAGRPAHHSSIRSLIAQFGSSIQIVKPVFMMTPQSVAALLPTESMQFDLVVFDEANQLQPSDAIGSITRGHQVVVVGDSKQLPPSRPDAAPGSADSILDLFCSRSAPQHILRWHHRCQHESLIALSNSLFYDNHMMVFPGPDRRRLSAGLTVNHLALPDTANAETGRETESKAIAKAVMDYAAQQLHAGPSERKTLGVATFNARQRDRIVKHIEQMRSLRPELADFFNETAREPFFVRDLENVQGDERDTIFISVGFGSLSEASLKQALAPLLRPEGERRLNVLFTRARRICEVFTTVRSVDISISEKSSSGLAAFKKFLNFAEYGHLSKPRHLDQIPVSTFEAELAETIERFGYTVQRRLSASEFNVDLLIVDPREPNRYVMGILCDGPAYRAAYTTRDRDSLREQTLTKMGWTLYRVWSTAWFLDRKDEEQKLVTALARATQLLEFAEDSAFIRHDTAVRNEMNSDSTFILKSTVN